MTPTNSLTNIRLATGADAAQLQDIYRHCIVEAPWQVRPAEAIPDFSAISRDEVIWVAVDAQDQVLALLAVQQERAYIHHLYVHPRAQGRGLGRALLVFLQTHMAFPWRLKCVLNNKAGMAFYQRLGWLELQQGHGADGLFVLLECSGLDPG
ncbi:GNAT family N-acetyltransferase [Undibacterium sp. CY18W]|uniref:GNAT family N-acetyltransferase n=1 Tax=Undibacterium hunanense TaxID=2762292 RepID=A0ABR6ZLW4_9BURK|nr:GNAT family N-acetyltransferase [Undibacterium hunanense]MBC3916908.1 GNAT family N-acetyltransferase [Undibacterium hunanense]